MDFIRDKLNAFISIMRMDRLKKLGSSKKVLGIGALFIVLLIVLLVFSNRTFHDYRVHEDTVVKKSENTSQYLSVGRYILRYSGEGASLLNHSLESRWNVTYDMPETKVDVCDKTILIYERNGTSIRIFDTKGQISSFQAPSPIVKACISADGNVAVLLTDASSTLLKYFTPSGAEIAVISPSMDNTGYPVDFDVTEDGKYMAVSYMIPAGNSVNTNLVFYDFGSDGQVIKDNVIKTQVMEDTICPMVRYQKGTNLLAVRENGFTVFNGKNPSVSKEVDFDEEIISTFISDDRVGFVFENTKEGTEEPYVLRLYDHKGVAKTAVRIPTYYNTIQTGKDRISFIGSTDLTIVDHNGHICFDGTLQEGDLQAVLRTGGNKYLLVSTEKTEIINLK